MLTFVFAETGGCIDSECLGYQGRAISCIRVKMGSVDEATTESTIGAILLLAGVEVCLFKSLLYHFWGCKGFGADILISI